MKPKFFLIVVFSLLSFDVDAQDILKKIGQSVGNAVKKEVVKKVKEGVKNKGHRPSQQNQQEAAPVSLPSEPESPEGKILVPDEGQNVVPDSTLYYIDEYGINHFSGENVEISPYAFPHEANAVRCVKDIEGQSMFKK